MHSQRTLNGVAVLDVKLADLCQTTVELHVQILNDRQSIIQRDKQGRILIRYRAQHLSIADAGSDLHGRVFAVRLPCGGHEGRLETGDRSSAADIGYTVAQSA